MYRWLVPHVIFPLAERLAGRRMLSELRRLRELQWRSRDEIEAITNARLRSLIAHAAENVPYYRDLFARAGIAAGDLKGREDLSRLPITTKVELRAGFPERTTASNIVSARRQSMMTSGSSGYPFQFFWDRAVHDVLFGSYLFSLEWAGVALWDSRLAILIPSGFATNTVPVSRVRTLARRLVLGEHNVRLPADSLTPAALRACLSEISGGRRYFIRGYPSAIAWLARQVAAEGAPLAGTPAAVITYAETLTPENARSIAEVFRCPVFNYYSSWDIPHIAQTCPDNTEVLHVHSDRVILRIVRPDGGDAAPGESGRVVVTDLANQVMPFINYALGDTAVAGDTCPCGRGFPAVSLVEGRDTEVIRTPAGRQISGVVLGHFLTFEGGVIPSVAEYQAEQTAPGAVTLRVVPAGTITHEIAATLRNRVATFLGPGIEVSLEVVERIPIERSGKRLIIRPLRESPSRPAGHLLRADLPGP